MRPGGKQQSALFAPLSSHSIHLLFCAIRCTTGGAAKLVWKLWTIQYTSSGSALPPSAATIYWLLGDLFKRPYVSKCNHYFIKLIWPPLLKTSNWLLKKIFSAKLSLSDFLYFIHSSKESGDTRIILPSSWSIWQIIYCFDETFFLQLFFDEALSTKRVIVSVQ